MKGEWFKEECDKLATSQTDCRRLNKY